MAGTRARLSEVLGPQPECGLSGSVGDAVCGMAAEGFQAPAAGER